MLFYFIIPCLRKSQNLHGKSKNQKSKNIRFLQKHVRQNACSRKCKNFDPLRVLDFFAQDFFFCHFWVDPLFRPIFCPGWHSDAFKSFKKTRVWPPRCRTATTCSWFNSRTIFSSFFMFSYVTSRKSNLHL